MHSTLAAQLAQLELGHLSIERPATAGTTDVPDPDAVEQTLAAIWSDLLALFPDTALEDDLEEIAWGIVNIFHRAAAKRSAQVDRATDEIRCLLASADGSEVHSTELEEQVERARAAEAAMIGLEAFREAAARLYINETGSSWRPATGSRPSHDSRLTSAVVDGRDFLRARAESRRRASMPEGTAVLFAGGRLSFPTADDAKALAGSVWETLDKVRERVADMVLVHGGDTKGLDRLAAAWAERRKVAQVAFGLDRRLGPRAGFRRNEQMLSLNPRCLVAFAGNGVLERLVIQAKAKGVHVVDRRGPLGSNPKRSARDSAASQ
jgi:SLOG family YspA-like protein